MSDAASPTRPCRADVVASYDLGVGAYEKLWSPVILPAAVALVPWLGLGDGSVVADVGAGTGALAGAIASASPTARVVALDPSAEMLRLARLQRGAAAVQADALALPLASRDGRRRRLCLCPVPSGRPVVGAARGRTRLAARPPGRHGHLGV